MLVYCYVLGNNNFTEVVVVVVVMYMYIYKRIIILDITNMGEKSINAMVTVHQRNKEGYVGYNVFCGALFGNLGTVWIGGSKGSVSEDVTIQVNLIGYC